MGVAAVRQISLACRFASLLTRADAPPCGGRATCELSSQVICSAHTVHVGQVGNKTGFHIGSGRWLSEVGCEKIDG